MPLIHFEQTINFVIFNALLRFSLFSIQEGFDGGPWFSTYKPTGKNEGDDELLLRG